MEDVKRNEEELKEFYRKSIVEVVGEIDNARILKIIQAFAIQGREEEKAGLP